MAYVIAGADFGHLAHATGGQSLLRWLCPHLPYERKTDMSESANTPTVVLAVSQRPFAAIFDDRAQAAAWKTLPSWAVVVTSDKAIPPDGERHMAKRAGAQIIEVDASHSIALSQPAAVAELIR